MKKTMSEGIKGEQLNILLGCELYPDEKISDRVKLNVMSILNGKYGITERDFQSAELCAVPAFKARDLGLDPQKVNDSYAMSEIARQFEMGKNPTSKTNMLRTLQMVVTAMLGEGYKATSHDVNFLLSVYSRKNRKALVVSCANHRNFRAYIAEVCHRIVTGKEYELEYKTKREG